MALVGSLSGSGGASNTINVTGSMIIANPGTGGLFPDFPGADTVFFVSGAIGGKAAGSRTVSVFGGDVVASGSITIGTGSITIDSNEIRFLGGAAKITSSSAGLTFFDSNNTGGKSLTELAAGGGGGGGDSVFTVASAIAAFTTSSIAIGYGAAASTLASDLFFYVSGSTDGTKNALFGGDVVTSGSVTVRDNTSAISIGYGPSTGVGQITSLNGNLVLDTVGGSRVIVDTDLEVAGTNIYAGGGGGARNIFTDNDTPAKLITIGGVGGKTTVAGGLEVTGNYISGSAGVNLTLGSSGDVAVAGALTVTGNDIKSSTATVFTLAGADVTTAGKLTVTGDLTVNGTTTTIDTTNLLVEDPIILMASGAAGPNRNGGIAIFSGSADTTALGARTELVFGRVANDTWGAGKINTNNGTSTDLTLMSLLPVRASKLELGGTTAFVTSSLGTDLIAQASTGATLKATGGDVNLDAGTGAGVDILFNGTQAGAFTGTGATILNLFARDGIAGSTARSLVLSGSDVTIGAHSTVTNFSFAGTNSGLASSTSGFTLASAAGLDLNLSGSNNFRIRHGSSGVAFQQHSLPYLAIASGSNALSTNLALVTGTPGKDAVFGGSSLAILSGSEVFLDAGANGVNVRRDSSTFLSFSSGSTNALTISTPISTTANLLNTTVTSLNIGGAATLIEIGSATGTTSINHVLTVDGNTVLGSSSSSKITFTGQAASSLVPDTNNLYDLGQPNLRWRNMYTGDLHLRNERGDWTIIEEEEFLTITNNKNGKRYKFCLEEI